MSTETETKACVACKIIKPLDDFHRCKHFKDGHHYRCKVCRSEEWKKPVENLAEWNPFIEEEKKQSPDEPRYQFVESRCPVANRDGTHDVIMVKILLNGTPKA